MSDGRIASSACSPYEQHYSDDEGDVVVQQVPLSLSADAVNNDNNNNSSSGPLVIDLNSDSNVYINMEMNSSTEESTPDTSTTPDVELVPMKQFAGRARRLPQQPNNTHTDDLNHDIIDDIMDERPSNEKLLSVAFFSFMGFTICQTIAAVIANSEAMMGDSAAMFVDALTYCFNLLAEKRKQRMEDSNLLNEWIIQQYPHETDPTRKRRLKRRIKRKQVLHLELIPPLLSVTSLIGVTVFVLNKAVRVLVLDSHRSKSLQSNPNLQLMLCFSILNLLLDIMNVFCFARAKRLLGYETRNDHTTHGHDGEGAEGDGQHHQHFHLPRNYEYLGEASEDEEVILQREYVDEIDGLSLQEQMDLMKEGDGGNQRGSRQDTDDRVNGDRNEAARHSADPPETNGHQHAVLVERNGISTSSSSSLPPTTANHPVTPNGGKTQDLDNSDHTNSTVHEQPNLNMCSAYTHVFADTLRSIAVVIAAVIAELVDGVTPEEADATAAVIVSVLIVLSLIPLFQGLVHTFSELKAIRAEEESERMFPKEAIARTTVVAELA